MTHQPAISFSISFQHPFNRAGGRTSNVRQRKPDMNTTSLGFGFCSLGCLLYALNFLAAILRIPYLTSWETSGGRIGEAFSQVGYQPTIVGAGLFILGITLIVIGCLIRCRRK